MDSFQQSHGYIRPPHPPDPHHHFHQMPPPPLPPLPPRQPAPPQAPWYSSQFQYHHPSQTPSPPPQWPQPPQPQHAEHYPPAASYPPPPPSSNPYPYHPSQFHAPPPPPPPLPHARSHAPPPPPPQFTPHSHVSQQPYHQEWSNPSWPANQGYPAQNNEEDWAAKARAWAAKSTMESQHPQPHFSPAGRVQEQNHYHDQYQQSADSRYTDVQNQSHPSSTYQQFSYLDASAQRLSGHSQDAASISLETSYTSDGHSYGARDGTNTGDPTVPFEQGNLPTNPSVHQQEVPSSYSSVTGKEAAEHIQQSYTMFPPPVSSSQEQQHVQPPLQATFAPGSNSVDPAISLADQPLDFAPRFSHDSDLQMQSTYSHHDSGTSMNNWAAPVAPAGGYAPIPAILASGPQHDPSISGPGHVAPPFGRFPGPGLPPAIPPTSAPFALSTGAAVHPTAAFSADPYGVPERPKKASVPNWLREEIKKTVIAAPSAEHPKAETSMDDGIGKTYAKGDETDSKSIDSSRSDEEEDEEDLAEAARTAAINLEIKRVLTEVLLKVTDELFDEIATKVLDEDGLTAEVGHNGATSNHKPSASPPSSVQVPKASAKVLVPVKAKEFENDVAIEKSNSSSPGDVLGLGNYGSDADDGDDEIESSSVPTPSKDATNRSRLKKSLEDTNSFPVNSSSQLEEHGRSQTKLEDKPVKTGSLQPRTSNGAATDQFQGNKVTRELDNSNSKDNRGTEALERSHNGFNGFSSKDSSGLPKSELPGKNAAVEKAIDDNPVREGKRRSEKNDRHDRSSEKESVKEVHVNKTGTDEKSDEIHRRKDEKRGRKEKRDYNSEAKERKELNLRHGEKAKESERKKSSHDVKDDKKEADKPHRSSGFEDTSRRREHTKDKGEHKSRQKDASNPDKHKRRRSSSVGSRGRTSRDHAVNHSGVSSGEGSDGSKRKPHSRRRDLSPSPVRSKRRQVSRSPYSKRSQRRHSPYSSLDNSRKEVKIQITCSAAKMNARLKHHSLFFNKTWQNTTITKFLPNKTQTMKESFKVELWSIWLSGLVLIGLSLYATQRLPLHNKDQSRITISKLNNNVASDSTGLRITIFTAPKPFKGSTGTKQSLAVQSWLALSPNVAVVLFSKDPSVASFSGDFGSRVLVDTNIDFTFLGTPFLHSMIARSHSFTSDIYVIVDPETVILSGFISTLNHAYELDHDWLLVASSQNVSHFPFHLDNSGKHWLLDNGEHVKIHEIQKMLQQNWQGNQCYTSMIIAWNNNDAPLHNGVLPPFLYNKGIHNNWLIHEAMSSEFRFVFDATLTITSFHLNGDQDIENREWEYIGNSHLGAHYGSFFFSEANYSSIPKLFKCYKQYIILDTDKNIVYPIRHSRKMNLWKENIFSSWLEKNTMHCIACLKSQIIRILDCSLKGQMKTSEPLEIPFSLESLLSISADETKTIVLTTAGFSYKDMLMSWVCRLRKLSIENFIVCALDQETYQFSILQGIPVFKDPLVPSNISFDDCHFGTKCFQRVTKVKSRMVLKILKLGYNVLLSDVDTYWFKNPIPLLQSFGPAVLAAQSDEFNKKGPINLPRRLNSGFYYAHSDGQTIAAMEKVVRHAQTSSLSEQPSFYDMLCGTGGSNRVDDNRCVESETNMTVYFLDRDLFPNGAYQDLWQKKNVSAACLKKGCFIIHNNWISGRLKKLERQVMSGLWEYDSGTRMCLQSWHTIKP
ncbi:hypothetical protein Ahy_B03g062824 isoform C [Arachis hypogaea]|uniref:Nucleotide-diphospho-sugar transferase domain-containing protein n=1 Tax=Arachis hypogaea TaxID=3818 RepID=A0A444ZVK7_ARAHY|nr:hypothetical protein Ahy_B03g062824 isoform C [Arachis hypogaea]